VGASDGGEGVVVDGSVDVKCVSPTRAVEATGDVTGALGRGGICHATCTVPTFGIDVPFARAYTTNN
jgi:hypothetical protein